MSLLHFGEWKTPKTRPACGVRFTCSRCGSQAEVWRESRSTEWSPGHWMYRSEQPSQYDDLPDGWIYEGYASRPQRWWCSLCSPAVVEWRQEMHRWEEDRRRVSRDLPWRLLPAYARVAIDGWLRRNKPPPHPYGNLCR